MKTGLYLLICMLAATTAFSQTKNTGKAVISTPGAHCEMCQKRIEGWLSRQYGVTSAKVDLKKKVTIVTWIPDRANIEDVKAYINNLGYDADNEAAEETAYFRLPKGCQTKIIADTTKPAQRNVY